MSSMGKKELNVKHWADQIADEVIERVENDPRLKKLVESAEILRQKYSERISMVDVDCSTQVNKPVCKQKAIENVPTLMYQKYDINSNKHLDEVTYEGGLDYENVSNLIENKLL